MVGPSRGSDDHVEMAPVSSPISVEVKKALKPGIVDLTNPGCVSLECTQLVVGLVPLV